MAIQDIINTGFIKQICDKILQGIEKVQNAPEYEHRRWIWELMQNAKDVESRPEFGGISIKITLYPDKIIFSHNGDPFSYKHLTSLVMQVSSKDDTGEDEETTGKFGTGFISTHMLSRFVKVKGVVKTDTGSFRCFEIGLDRNGGNFAELKPRVEQVLQHILKLDSNDEQFPEIPNYHPEEQQMETHFEYPLDEKGLEIARKGICDLHISLPYTMVFISKIKSIIIEDYVDNQFYTVSLEKKINLGSLALHTFVQEHFPVSGYSQDASYQKLHIVSSIHDGFVLAQRIEDLEGQLAIRKNEDTLPKLFRDFPLVGTSDFYLPVVFNSHQLYPTESRDGIYLKNTDSVNVVSNRNILEHALPEIQQFITHMIQADWNNLHLLALSSLPGNSKDYIDLKWYEEKIQKPLRKFLLEQPIVLTKNGKIKIVESSVPLYKETNEKREQFYQLVFPLIGDKVPQKQYLLEWVDIITAQYESWGANIKYSLENFLGDIAETGSLSKLQELIDNDTSPIPWLNEVIQFLIDEDLKSQLERYAIIPNQNGSFRKILELKYDDNIHPLLIEVLKDMGDDWREILIEKDILKIQNHPALSVKDISSEINKHIKMDATSNSSPANSSEAEQINSKEKGLFSLVGYLTSGESKQRIKIWEFAKRMFPSKIADEYAIIQGSADFNWDVINKWIICKILFAVQEISDLKALQEYINDNEENTLFFVNDIITFLFNNADFKELLNEYRATPCQYGDFRYVKDLKNDIDSIPDDLKDILFDLSEKKIDYKADLLHLSVAITTGNNFTLKEICAEIDELIIRKRNDSILLEDSKSPALKVINLIKKERPLFEPLFPRLINQFAQIQVELMEEHQEDINRILQHEEKIKALAAIAESNLTPDDIEKMISLVGQSNLPPNQVEELISIVGELGYEVIVGIVDELIEEKRDFEFKRQIGAIAENSFQNLASVQDLSLVVIQKDGAQDFVFRKHGSTKEYAIEIKSIANGAEYVLMSKWQGQKAVEHPDDYCLCIIEREKNNFGISQEYFIQHARFLKNIGHLLKETVAHASKIDETIDRHGGIEIDFQDRRYKFKIYRQIWSNAEGFESFRTWLTQCYFNDETAPSM